MTNWQRKFYKSKAWKLMRAAIIERDNSICQICGEYALESPEIDHVIELTEENYSDYSVSLNPELLRVLCHSCHDRRHGRFSMGEKKTIVGDDLEIDYSRR